MLEKYAKVICHFFSIFVRFPRKLIWQNGSQHKATWNKTRTPDPPWHRRVRRDVSSEAKASERYADVVDFQAKRMQLGQKEKDTFRWYNYRRKFRSLTSDNMESWKSSAARKKINRCGKKEAQQARNVREVAKCCVFQCFVCRLGRKVTSLKRRVRRKLCRGHEKNCTPL